MKEIIKHIIRIEKMAGQMYEDASVLFQEDGDFASFLGSLAKDESHHAGIMASAELYFRVKPEDPPPFIALDEITKESIECPFIEAKEKLLAGTLTKEDMISCIVSSEFSEWNHIFLYVVSTLTTLGLEFEKAVVNIQQHKKLIETFLESLPAGRQHLETIRALPPVRPEKILIAVESEPRVKFLAGLFEHVAIVETASDGKEALRKTREHYFDVIISDADIWGVSGIEFYRQAAERDPGIGERFLFLTGFSKPETLDFLSENNLRHLIKPATIEELKKAVSEITARGSTPK
jgi:CheY-like chemotaxis protein